MNEKQRRLLAYIRQIQERDGITSDHLREMRAQRKEGMSRGARPIISDESLSSWERFENNASLREEDYFHLESVILQNGLRPAFDIQHDTYETLPSTWQLLNDRKPTVQTLIRGIGRLELIGHPLRRFIGTAFVCGDRLLITNRHVADEFVSHVGSETTLAFSPGITPFLDLKQEIGLPDSLVLKITAPLTILAAWDIALFEVRQLPTGVRPLPLASTPPQSLNARVAAVVGYPSLDPESDLLQQMQIFRNTFDKKRIMPGRLIGLAEATSYGQKVEALGHDCTTLGGNSGSAVIDVETGLVFGIHFAGHYLLANYAVPTWELANESQIKDKGINFVNN
jgi:endonuclease G